MRRLNAWLPPLVYMAAIFYSSSQPNPMPTLTERVSDKLLHFVEYAGLAVLVARALRRDGTRWPLVAVAAALLSSLYGASDEFHQMFVPGRFPAVRDWVADTLGAAIGAVVYSRASRGR